MIFLRSKDVAEYIERLEKIISAMANDLHRITEFPIEELMDDYARITAPPTILELILKDKGVPPLEHISLVDVWLRRKELEEEGK